MSLEALSAKRLRRQWEPEEKAWHDDALDQPWEDMQPPLHKATMFALKNVFFFSHATPVQASTIKEFAASGNSAIVEAPTGSGKTLGFLIPLMERTIRTCEAFVAVHKRPPLTRNILGVILSPSRTLAEQTFVVAKSLAARFPFNIQFALCDGVVEKPKQVVSRLRSNTRGAGTFLVTTPKDLAGILLLLEGGEGTSGEADVAQGGDAVDEKEILLAAQDEETRSRYYAKRQRLEQQHQQQALASSPTSGAKGASTSKKHKKNGKETAVQPSQQESPRADDQTLRFFVPEGSRFIVVIDEADLVFNSPEMREIVSHFISTHCQKTTVPTTGAKKDKKRLREVREDANMDVLLPSDFAFVGATVATSQLVHAYATELCETSGTALHLVAARTSDDFVSQLRNRYLVCDAYNFLPFLIQMMNLHASKKHFIFFNSFRALQFVQRLFSILSQGTRPLLFVKDVYTMYEGMTESARIEQYNKFLTHISSTATASAIERAKKTKQGLSDAQKRNQIFSSGWKRDSRAPMGTGAILLCTDIAAFGLDVRDVDYVYHFEAPATVQSYVHRVGRVGRMGMKGNSILLLPCIDASQQTMEQARERKTTSTRFNTVTNTKNSTQDLQVTRMSVENLTEERRRYVSDLSTHSSLEEYSLPPFAPITATLRNVISQDEKLLKLAKAAAIFMCQPVSDEKVSWFTPKLALHSLLLD